MTTGRSDLKENCQVALSTLRSRVPAAATSQQARTWHELQVSGKSLSCSYMITRSDFRRVVKLLQAAVLLLPSNELPHPIVASPTVSSCIAESLRTGHQSGVTTADDMAGSKPQAPSETQTAAEGPIPAVSCPIATRAAGSLSVSGVSRNFRDDA